MGFSGGGERSPRGGFRAQLNQLERLLSSIVASISTRCKSFVFCCLVTIVWRPPGKSQPESRTWQPQMFPGFFFRDAVGRPPFLNRGASEPAMPRCFPRHAIRACSRYPNGRRCARKASQMRRRTLTLAIPKQGRQRRLRRFSPQPGGTGPVSPISASLVARRRPVCVAPRSWNSEKPAPVATVRVV